MSRVLIAGDVHSNVRHAQGLGVLAARAGAGLVIQVGDFNFFPHLGEGARFLTDVAETARTSGVPWLFIDGNHDNHAALSEAVPDSSGTAPVDGAGWVRYVPRGSRLRIGGRVFGFLGGAFSIDKGWRTPGFDWWPGEEPTHDDVETLGVAPVDVLVTHDAPGGFEFDGKMRLPQVIEDRARMTRDRLAEAVSRTRPKVVVCGHWHRRETRRVNGSTVEVLNCDGTGAESWLLVDLPSVTVIGDPVRQARAVSSDGQ